MGNNNNNNALITDLLSILRRGEAAEISLQLELCKLSHSCSVAQWDTLIDVMLDAGTLSASLLIVEDFGGPHTYPTLAIA